MHAFPSYTPDSEDSMSSTIKEDSDASSSELSGKRSFGSSKLAAGCALANVSEGRACFVLEAESGVKLVSE